MILAGFPAIVDANGNNTSALIRDHARRNRHHHRHRHVAVRGGTVSFQKDRRMRDGRC